MARARAINSCYQPRTVVPIWLAISIHASHINSRSSVQSNVAKMRAHQSARIANTISTEFQDCSGDLTDDRTGEHFTQLSHNQSQSMSRFFLPLALCSAPPRANFSWKSQRIAGKSSGSLSIMNRRRKCLPNPRLNCVNCLQNTAHFVDTASSKS